MSESCDDLERLLTGCSDCEGYEAFLVILSTRRLLPSSNARCKAPHISPDVATAQATWDQKKRTHRIWPIGDMKSSAMYCTHVDRSQLMKDGSVAIDVLPRDPGLGLSLATLREV